jgi:hypothetical protein
VARRDDHDRADTGQSFDQWGERQLARLLGAALERSASDRDERRRGLREKSDRADWLFVLLALVYWKIVDDCLFLADIDGIYRWEGRLTVFAHWVTDILRIAEGDLLRARLDNLPSEDTGTPGLSLARRWSLRDLLDE